MKVSPELIKLLKHHEGVRLRPYQCPAMLWSIAIGHVIDPSHIAVKYADRKNLPIPPGWDRQLSMGEVDAILAQDLSRFERGVARLCPGSVNHQGQFDALVSLSFNIGLGNTQRSSVRTASSACSRVGRSPGLLAVGLVTSSSFRQSAAGQLRRTDSCGESSENAGTPISNRAPSGVSIW